MKILFDFDLHNNHNIDLHLTDILLTLKRALIKEMQPYKEEIENDKGEFVITLLPKNFGITYGCRHPENLIPK